MTYELCADGTLIIDLSIEVEKVRRILLTKSKTDIGCMYYLEEVTE